MKNEITQIYRGESIDLDLRYNKPLEGCEVLIELFTSPLDHKIVCSSPVTDGYLPIVQDEERLKVRIPAEECAKLSEGVLLLHLTLTAEGVVRKGTVRLAEVLPARAVADQRVTLEQQLVIADNGIRFTMDLGAIEGKPGRSAYQAAAEGGYKGLEEQFNSQLANTARTYLVNLYGADYQPVALQVVADMAAGHPVILYIRAEAGGPLRTMTVARDTGDAYLFSTAEIEGTQTEGVAELQQVQYLISKATGNIDEVRSKLLSKLLTTDAVLDSPDGDSPMPISQRAAKVLKKAIDTLDKTTIKKDDVLIFDGNGFTNNQKTE